MRLANQDWDLSLMEGITFYYFNSSNNYYMKQGCYHLLFYKKTFFSYVCIEKLVIFECLFNLICNLLYRNYISYDFNI